MLVQSLQATNLLSFGPDTEALELRPLNVLIGPNGSGKSNLIEALSLLQAAPEKLATPIRRGGGIQQWIWHGRPDGVPHLDALLKSPDGDSSLRHRIGLAQASQRFQVVEEELIGLGRGNLFRRVGSQRWITSSGSPRPMPLRDLDPELSVLAQRRDPERYPELTWLGDQLRRIRIYRDWSMGRDTPPRRPQPADLPNDFLMPDASNLGLVLNQFRLRPASKRALLEHLGNLYEDIEDFDVKIEGGTVQVFLQEGDWIIPATRLSDGTLRYLCLLAILCHPDPPPLICLEEPELGLHPDLLPNLARLLVEASERTQLVVTTHSDVLVDALTPNPESVVICEKQDGATRLRRLSEERLRPWLEEYSLGRLWTRGDLGGTRW